MKSVKIILIAVEIFALCAVVFISFSETTEIDHWMKAVFISEFAILAVVMQREQQSIEWDEYEEEMILTSVEDVEL